MKKILACTDGSDYARVVCRYAGWLAGKTGARVEALYVSSLWEFELPFLLDLGGSLGASPYQGMTGALQEIEDKKAKLVSQAATRELMDAGVAVDDLTFNHETGLLVDALDDYETGDNAADILVLGKRGEGMDQAKEHLGGNLERVVRAARQPCFISNREFRPIKIAALAFDGSASAQKALDWLIAETELHDIKLHVLTVSMGHGDEQLARAMRIAESQLEDTNIDAEIHLLTGDVEDQISGFVQMNGIDLLMMGAYGHSRIRELLIGSTTTDLMRRCKIPIMLFR
ncbi:universal stress protein [Cerasicoccus maritimus]|uniref:universal stress protein n=1 Tax=Cerasicoccus maritimus TaxID=490089 RepID=UPI002852C666|nr:universal stress protein [Cerasicoccus maritimus]